MTMSTLDKNQQRMRALNQTQALMAQGHTAPVNPIPVKKVEGPKDILGRYYAVGQRIVRATKVGNANGVKISTVTAMTSDGLIFCDSMTRPLTHPELALIL